MTSQTPPGWYHDPYGTPGLQRYWDGNQWTQLTQPADEWGAAGGGAGGAAQQNPSGYLPGGAEAQQQPPEYGQQQPPDYGQQQPPGYGQQAPGYGQQTPEYGQQAPGYGYQQPSEYGQPQGGWPAPGGGADWNAGGQQAWPQQPPTGGKSSTGLMWALIGGGAVVAAIVVVVVLFATGVIGGDPAPTAGSTAAAPSTAPSDGASGPSSPGAAAGAKSPVTGTISDEEAGLSYAQLGGGWQRPEAVPPTSSLGKLGFHRGAAAVVQTNYNGPDSSYVASVYSGALSPNVRASSLEQAAKGVFDAVYPDSYPTPNTRKDLESKSYTVSGKKAWLYKVQLGFPQAETKGWNFSKETAVVVTVELQSGKPPAMLYISIPDSHKTQGDLDLLLGSLKAL